MSKNECVFCGKIGYRCPNKNFNGICRTNGEINEHGEKQPCKHTVTIKDGSSAFFAKHLYTIRNNKPHQISPISQPVNIYPNYLYCANIDTFCPYQSPGGKCTLIQFMQGRDVSTTCGYQIY
ncbi:MAG: hypothetical protein IKZ34_00185, partial [Alphaproteobacteria bacterium]|nr:hypothetical protein [Alphaproteobacteria bacterium]